MGDSRKAKNIEQGYTKVYLKNEYKTGGSEIRLISWLVDGKSTPLRLERRDYFLDHEGNRRNAKCKGFTSEDLSWILEHYHEIEADMMAASTQAKQATEATQANQDASGEEVPF